MLNYTWHIISPFTILVFVFFPLFSQAANLQPGQNLWHLTAAIGTQVDELAIAQAACCVGTFTSLESIQANISNTCAHTPLTISSAGTNINSPGVYCLTNDVLLTSTSSTIAINSSNVVLDLNNHTIQGPTPPSFTPTIAITINDGLSGVSIINGNITSPTGGGMSIAGNCIQIGDSTNITLEDLTMYNCNVGVTVNSATGKSILTFNNLIFENTQSTPILINNYQSCVMRNCIANASGVMRVQTNITGGNETQVTFNNCNGNGFNVINTNAIFENCTAFGGGFDLNIPTAGNPASTCSFILNNCVSLQSSFGYKLSNQNNSASNVLKAQFNNCKAATCSTGGYIVDANTSYLQTSHINCTAESCATAAPNTAGFDFSNVNNDGTSKCNIQNCSATNNQFNGFQGNNSTEIIFCNNQAFQNGTNYFNRGSASAPENTLTSTTRLWGDNLSN